MTVTIEPLFVDKKKAAAMLGGISVRTFERLSRTEELLKPRQIGDRRVGYLVDDLRKWAASRPVSDQLPPPDSGHGRGGKNTADEPPP